ncbi:hypothetical protein [Salinicoccus albus]|uniref:hypothetical protein n=1 Tax=Salinicoccus albus TaxID=418756 RepID=UPI0003775DE4|nr:hypothetical protein [Salinicoccus albus]
MAKSDYIEPNQEYVIQSLSNQLARANMQIAEQESIITDLYNQLKEQGKQPAE